MHLHVTGLTRTSGQRLKFHGGFNQCFVPARHLVEKRVNRLSICGAPNSLSLRLCIAG